MAHLRAFPVVYAASVSVLFVLLLGGLVTEDLNAVRCEAARTTLDTEQRKDGNVVREKRDNGYRRYRGREEYRGVEEKERFEKAEEDERRIKLEFDEAREVLQTDGGAIRLWSQKIDAVRNVAVGVAEIELEEDGLLLPHYSDSPHIAYVLQGRGHMGIVLPGIMQAMSSHPYVREVQKGDVIAIPKGAIVWWYNDGNEVHRVLCAFDTSFSVDPGRHHAFALVGGKQRHFGSLLGGFSRDVLAMAWGLDETTIESLLRSQSEVGIVRARRSIRFPRYPPGGGGRRGWDEDSSNDVHNVENRMTELHYSPPPSQPDFFVERGGIINVVNIHKLPALRHIKMSALSVSLDKNAMLAPCFASNAHQLIYVTGGNGRIQVASGDGRKVFDEEVQEGSFIVIPQFFPSIKIAGERGLQWVDLLTSDRPLFSFLAGRNSVYRAMPKEILTAAFNVDEQILEELGRDEVIIFPERSASGRRRRMRV